MVDFSLVIWGLPVAPRAKDSCSGAFRQNLGSNRFEQLNTPFCWSAIGGQWSVSGQSMETQIRMVVIHGAAMPGLDAHISPVCAESLMRDNASQRCDL